MDQQMDSPTNASFVLTDDPTRTCNQTLVLASSRTFSAILASEVAAGPLGILANVLLIISISRAKSFHTNLRILLIHLSANGIAYCASTAIRAAHALIAFASTDPCSIVIVSTYACRLEELAGVLPLNNLMYSVLSIGIERLYATVRRHNYEHGGSPVVSLVLLGATWSVTLGMQLSTLPGMSRTIVAPFCVNILLVTRSTAIGMLIVNIGQEFVGLITYSCTYVLNRFLYLHRLINRSSGQTLTSRFQMAQNMRVRTTVFWDYPKWACSILSFQVCRFMLPSVCIHMACWVPANTFVASVVAGRDSSFIDKVVMMHAAYLLAVIYCILHPTICFCLDSKMRELIRTLFVPSPKVQPATLVTTVAGGSRRVVVVGGKAQNDEHFDIMIKMWQQFSAAK